jgi:NAD(P)-dependent dehydrogenase (short-subunit alcohol dehydrogenase family)
MQLTGRVAFVTGGGSGIGRAICLRFAQEGATIVAVDLLLDRAEETIRLVQAAGGSGLALQANVADDAAVHHAVQQTLSAYSVIHVLVNNAAISQGNDILTIDEATWDLNLAVVLKSVFLITRAVLPSMLAQKRGAIVNISSVNGLTGIGEEPYSAAKAGVINLTKNLAVHYGNQGVRANVICPGTIQTPIWAERVRQDPTIFAKLAKWYPLGRVGLPEDVANAALFLASDQAAWITGAVLNVDGGLMAGGYRFAQELAGE